MPESSALEDFVRRIATSLDIEHDADWSMELVAEARRLLGLPEDEPQEDEIREAGGMTTTKPDCGYECGCPTLLEHRVHTIINRIEAPIEEGE